jgi:hypothetical protein
LKCTFAVEIAKNRDFYGGIKESAAAVYQAAINFVWGVIKIAVCKATAFYHKAETRSKIGERERRLRGLGAKLPAL